MSKTITVQDIATASGWDSPDCWAETARKGLSAEDIDTARSLLGRAPKASELAEWQREAQERAGTYVIRRVRSDCWRMMLRDRDGWREGRSFTTPTALRLYADETGEIPMPAGRPRRDPTAARVRVSYRVHPDTAALIDAEAKRTGDGAGQVLDRLAQALR